MKTYLFGPFLILFAGAQLIVSGQKLKKADRAIFSNIQMHTAHLGSQNMKDRKIGSEAEKLAALYIQKQLEHSGLKPKGDAGSWSQQFDIYDGKEILPSTYLSINSKKLALHKDYFPFPFSAGKSAEAAIAIALSENGVPWFKDLKDIVEDKSTTTRADTVSLIRKKAAHAARKGATALIVYNSSNNADLSYNSKDLSEISAIPVVYITKSAFKKYCSDESAILDIKLNVLLEPRKRTTANIIGYSDHGADSTVVTCTHMGEVSNIAILLEMARLMKPSQHRRANYLFIIFPGDKNELFGYQYYIGHPPVSMQYINYTMDIDVLRVADENMNDLALVKKAVDIIKNK